MKKKASASKPTWPADAWIAVRRGKIFCAPACGGGCTVAEHARASKAAAKLARDLDKLDLADGWIPEVTENLGWHYAVRSTCGRLRVHGYTHSGTTYSAFLDGGPSAPRGCNFVGQGATPKEAVRKAIAAARAEWSRIGKMIEGL